MLAQPAGLTCFIEVKALGSGVILSAREWQFAQDKSGSPQDRYVLVLVDINQNPPVISHFYQDPYALFQAGNLSITRREEFVLSPPAPNV